MRQDNPGGGVMLAIRCRGVSQKHGKYRRSRRKRTIDPNELKTLVAQFEDIEPKIQTPLM